MLRHTGLHLEAELAEIVGDECRRLLLTVRQLWILMNAGPDLDHGRSHLRGLLLDARKGILRGYHTCCRQEDYDC